MSGKLKILILGDINSIHLQKWITGLMHEFNLAVFSLDPLDESSSFANQINSKVHVYSNEQVTTNSRNKLVYLKTLGKLKEIQQKFQPDIVHAHYATSYGLLGSLIRPKKFLVSVWGTDVYSFPKRSFLHKLTFQFILKRTNAIFSTSFAMKKEIEKYTTKKITVIPFGIDADLFSPGEKVVSKKNFIVGTVKTLEHVYGIDRLIRAFAIFHSDFPESECRIYGTGSQLDSLKKLSLDLNVSNSVHFMGYVSNKFVPEKLREMDVYCALSRQESFGVAVVEASACGIPVIVTDVGGLPEVVEDGKTGYIVKGKAEEVAKKLVELYKNTELRTVLGRNGRNLVLEKYDWNKNISSMKIAYISIGTK